MRRAYIPTIESVERRQLLSGITAVLGAHRLVHSSPGTLTAAVASGGSSILLTPHGTIVPQLPYEGSQPTPRELAREQFKAVFTVEYRTGQPLFLDQVSRTVARGVGGSTGFRHGSVQLQVVTPRDPTADLAGEATLQDRNLNTSGYLAVDLTGTRADLDQAGRPTHMTWSLSPFAGSGSFTAGTFSLATGQGDMFIRYRPEGHPDGSGVSSQGTATVLFKGLLFVPQTTGPIRNTDLQARGGRFHARG